MKKEEIFSGKTQGKYLSAAKIICFSFLSERRLNVSIRF